MPFRILIFFFTLLLTANIPAKAEESDIDYKPVFHGTVRSRWELATENGENRFQVRNARLSVEGRIAPEIQYYINTDLCDRGKMKILDAWGQINITDDLKARAGQFRMPFGVDPFRGPQNYIFANRSFIGKQVCNVRAVGAKLEYSLPVIPLKVEAGAFNPSTISDHETWHRKMSYASKATYTIDCVKLATGIQSLSPDSVRMNLIDGSISWSADRWTVEGEYMYKHYTHKAHKACHAYSIFADYRMPVNAGIFNTLSFQGRFDGMTAHSNGTRNEDGLLTTTDPARNRITAGATLSYVKKALHADIRVNYEKYFYRHDAEYLPGDGDKLVVELVVRF